MEDRVNGERSTECALKLEDFQVLATTPECYGPSIDFEGHPDASYAADEDGELPSGDLGIWKEKEGSEARSAS